MDERKKEDLSVQDVEVVPVKKKRKIEIRTRFLEQRGILLQRAIRSD